MPVYDFSSGFQLANQGIQALGQGMQNAYNRQQMQSLAGALSSDPMDINGAIQAAGNMGNIDAVLKLITMRQQQQVDAQLAGGGSSIPGGATGIPKVITPPKQSSSDDGDGGDGKQATAAQAAIASLQPVAGGPLPAGLRNNNPGNLKFSNAVAYAGSLGPSRNLDQGDPQIVFSDPDAGIRASAQLALHKYNSGMTSANSLIAAKGGWTPYNTGAAANVARTMGLGPNDDLNLNNPANLQSFLRALYIQEQGGAAHTVIPRIPGALGRRAEADLPTAGAVPTSGTWPLGAGFTNPLAPSDVPDMQPTPPWANVRIPPAYGQPPAPAPQAPLVPQPPEALPPGYTRNLLTRGPTSGYNPPGIGSPIPPAYGQLPNEQPPYRPVDLTSNEGRLQGQPGEVGAGGASWRQVPYLDPNVPLPPARPPGFGINQMTPTAAGLPPGASMAVGPQMANAPMPPARPPVLPMDQPVAAPMPPVRPQFAAQPPVQQPPAPQPPQQPPVQISPTGLPRFAQPLSPDVGGIGGGGAARPGFTDIAPGRPLTLTGALGEKPAPAEDEEDTGDEEAPAKKAAPAEAAPVTPPRRPSTMPVLPTGVRGYTPQGQPIYFGDPQANLPGFLKGTPIGNLLQGVGIAGPSPPPWAGTAQALAPGAVPANLQIPRPMQLAGALAGAPPLGGGLPTVPGPQAGAVPAALPAAAAGPLAPATEEVAAKKPRPNAGANDPPNIQGKDPGKDAADAANIPSLSQMYDATTPGSPERIQALLRLQALSARSSNPEGWSKYYQGLIDLEKTNAPPASAHEWEFNNKIRISQGKDPIDYETFKDGKDNVNEPTEEQMKQFGPSLVGVTDHGEPRYRDKPEVTYRPPSDQERKQYPGVTFMDSNNQPHRWPNAGQLTKAQETELMGVQNTYDAANQDLENLMRIKDQFQKGQLSIGSGPIAWWDRSVGGLAGTEASQQTERAQADLQSAMNHSVSATSKGWGRVLRAEWDAIGNTKPAVNQSVGAFGGRLDAMIQATAHTRDLAARTIDAMGNTGTYWDKGPGGGRTGSVQRQEGQPGLQPLDAQTEAQARAALKARPDQAGAIRQRIIDMGMDPSGL